MASRHLYSAALRWTGNRGDGTASYRAYDRTWDLVTPGKPVVHCSNDPLLGGDPARHNPEDLLVAAVASCHMLWFLHLASDAGIAVQAYSDSPEATGEIEPSGAGRFLSMELRPMIVVPRGTDMQRADALHGQIHKVCFIARSVNFPVTVAARYETA